jgi:hypothetical protein
VKRYSDGKNHVRTARKVILRLKEAPSNPVIRIGVDGLIMDSVPKCAWTNFLNAEAQGDILSIVTVTTKEKKNAVASPGNW